MNICSNRGGIVIFFLCFFCPIFCFADAGEGIREQSTELGTWKTLHVDNIKPEERYTHSMVSYNGKHYITCGADNSYNPNSDIWELDITNNIPTFTKIYTPYSNDELQKANSHATLVWDKKLYVLFGTMRDGTGYPDSIYSYDFRATTDKKWKREYELEESSSPNYFEPRYNFSAAAIGDKIYVFGGANYQFKLIDGDQVFGYFSYSSTDEKWTFNKQALGADAPEKRHGHSMISINNTLYLFGGSDVVTRTMFKDLWKYEVGQDKNTWEEIKTGQLESEIPEARGMHTMLANGNKEFWILGGYNGNNGLNDVWQFNIKKNKWTKKESAPKCFWFHGSVLQQEEKEMKIYVWGGWTNTRDILPADTIYEYTYIAEEEEE
ncbi:MAG TPA: kelch repeat-containing protein, partial [Planctomycetota bacterium]|nr:kelch repeat-containing protein [Planctomycetota bacterium]